MPGSIDARAASAIEAEPLAVRGAAPDAPPAAGHFVDWALAALPANELRAGGVLATTLDLDLQRALELAALSTSRACAIRAFSKPASS